MCKYLFFAMIMMGACKSSQKTQDVVISYQKDQIEVDLAGKMKPQRLIASFPKFGLQYLCTLNDSLNKGIYSFNTEVTDLDGMIQFLDGEVGVEGVGRTQGCKAH